MNTIYVTIALVALGVSGCATDQTAEIEQLKAEVAELRARTSPLPASLDNLFPPKSDAPVWLLHMRGMASHLMLSLGSLMDGDQATAATEFAAFKDAFIATSTLVPEWTARFDTSAFSAVERGLASGDPEATFAAMEELAEVCHGCHADNMVRVQQLYHWPKFADVSVTDGDRGELPFRQVMQEAEMSMVFIGASVQDGAPEKAIARLQAFRKSFRLMQEACESCHETERTYFVDEGVEALLDRLEHAVTANPPDGRAAGSLLQSIGEESCFKCHLVHMPAALEQGRTAHAAEGMSSH